MRSSRRLSRRMPLLPSQKNFGRLCLCSQAGSPKGWWAIGSICWIPDLFAKRFSRASIWTKISWPPVKKLCSSLPPKCGPASVCLFSNRDVFDHKRGELRPDVFTGITADRILASCSIPLVYPWTFDRDTNPFIGMAPWWRILLSARRLT